MWCSLEMLQPDSWWCDVPWRCCSLTADDVMFPGDAAAWQLMMWCSLEMLQPDSWWCDVPWRCCSLTVDDVMFPGDVDDDSSRKMLQPDGWWMKGYHGTFILRPVSWWWDIREWRCRGYLDRQIPLSSMLLISSLNALVRSSGFSLTTQTRLLLLPILSHGLTIATVSSWVHIILSSNLSRNFQTLLQDSFSWHSATTQHLSWKICIGFPFQNVLI